MAGHSALVQDAGNVAMIDSAGTCLQYITGMDLGQLAV